MRTIYLMFICMSFAPCAYTQSDSVDFSYPPLIKGSTWGEIFQRYYKLGSVDEMIKLTSDSSLKKYGRVVIREFYSKMDFGYQIKLKSWSEENCCYILNYDAEIKATHVVIRMVLQKGPIVKIILPGDYSKQKYFLYR